MKFQWKYGFAIVGAMIAASAVNGQSSGTQPAALNPERGAKLYRDVGCYQCHGLAAHGGVGPKLGPNPLPAKVIAAYIRNPGGVMPPYAQSVLSDQDVADITAWLQTLPESPPADAIEILPRLGG